MEVRTVAPRVSAGASAGVAALTTAVYVVVIQQEDNDPFWEILPWVAIMVVGTLLALGSALTRSPRLGRFTAAAATVVLGLLGAIAIFSVGLAFILAAALALLAAVAPSEVTATSV